MCPRLSIKSIYRVIYENHFTVTYNHFWSIKQFTPLNIYVFRERERSKHQSILPRCVDRLNKTEKTFSLKGSALNNNSIKDCFKYIPYQYSSSVSAKKVIQPLLISVSKFE